MPLGGRRRQDDPDADVVLGGPNGRLSLTQARRNFLVFGACEESMRRHVRPPSPKERPPN
ncbi:CPCC family cysteine-rich protein [Nonomuraea coxensis]|uniref:CPCC family cysteine-rich protein n=1 Tax=Nonomuraea coxensis TaxID=404386 RepID=UPI003D154C0A